MTIIKNGLIAIVRLDSQEQAKKTDRACVDCGIRILEIVYTISGVVKVIKS